MNNQYRSAPRSEDVVQTLHNINPSHVPTNAANTLPVEHSEAGFMITLDLALLCCLAEDFYERMSDAGPILAEEGCTVEKMTEWHLLLFSMRRLLAMKVSFVLAQHSHEGQTNPRPEETIDKAKYIAGRGTIVAFLRSLRLILLDACDENKRANPSGNDRCWECEESLGYLSEEANRIVGERE